MQKLVVLIKRLFGVKEAVQHIENVVIEAETKAEAQLHDIEKATEAVVEKVKAPRKPRAKKEVK
jgi:hypothetical protein